MANILMVAGKLVCIFCIIVLVVLIWKTAEYFNGLQMKDKNKPLIAWDMLMLFFLLISLMIRLIMA